jgi:hypothetical protein
MEIKQNGSLTSRKGPAEWFTGAVRIDASFQADEPARVGGAIVTFLLSTHLLRYDCNQAASWP